MREADGSAFEWIRNSRPALLANDNPGWKGNFVSHLMPTTFESYAKILHRIDANYTDIDTPLSEKEVVLLQIPRCEKLRSLIETARREGTEPRLRWETLARAFGVPYQPEICHEWFRKSMTEPGCWPRLLFGPGEGSLSPGELAAVLSTLQIFTPPQDCYFRFSEIAFIATDKPILFCGALDTLETFLKHGEYQLTPEYWWPVDRSWCLCSDYDLDFTIIGGSKALLSDLTNNAALEVLEIKPENRIDSLVPLPR